MYFFDFLCLISEENAASTEETNASMQELNATFAMISESANKLQTIATDLTSTISYFST
ncbi:methyl-accepting chemotaxis protein [Butyrivibrio fibrisolvens]|uniref:Methyl-accepting chemotaxis protein n=1 Tax=Butyrivibrio fibrisolvens TaxID=831 RepID=A0A1H9VGM5_BUTFI|nr:methyl-accepting chemotaxis protein [Butyrivibrio fibrisolvens]